MLLLVGFVVVLLVGLRRAQPPQALAGGSGGSVEAKEKYLQCKQIHFQFCLHTEQGVRYRGEKICAHSLHPDACGPLGLISAGWQTAPRQAVPTGGSRGSWCSGAQPGLATKSHAGEGSGDALGGAGTWLRCGIRCKAATLLLRPALDRSANPQLDYPGTLTVCADSKWELKRLCRR